MSTQTEAQFKDLESLFDADLEDIADLAAFETPPPGAYLLKVTTTTKEINDAPAVEAKFSVVETVDLKYKDPEHAKYRAPSKDGTEFSIAWILGNDIATGRMKQFLVPFAEHFGESGKGSVGRLVRDHIKDVTIAATITNRPSKDDPDVVYAGIKGITVA